MNTTNAQLIENSETIDKNLAMNWARTNSYLAVLSLSHSDVPDVTYGQDALAGDTNETRADENTGTGPTMSRNPTLQAPLNMPEALAVTVPLLNTNASTLPNTQYCRTISRTVYL